MGLLERWARYELSDDDEMLQAAVRSSIKKSRNSDFCIS